MLLIIPTSSLLWKKEQEELSDIIILWVYKGNVKQASEELGIGERLIKIANSL